MGAPIYLVSACTSGEEFIAAFRRYADKNGLFIPISEPFPPGGRARFAVTLRDGGVMIEGEAEIVSSARMPSVLHGRVGMTLRFVEPDEASQTTLGELVKARLAMKPAPPSLPPRPAQLPAEPRPVPPPVQGRIDAVNALAECVAIGDTSALGPALSAAAAPPRTAPRITMPAIPSGRSAPGTSPPGGLGLAARETSPPRPPTAPLPVPMTRPDAAPEARAEAEVPPPTITPRATPLSGRLRSAEVPAAPAPEPPPAPPPSGLSETITAVKSIEAGPTSETLIAATPPPPNGSAAPRPDKISATMTAVPAASPASPSAPTEIGGVLVDPLPALEPGAASSPAIVMPVADDDPSARTQIHAGAPRPMVPPAAPAAISATRRAAPEPPDERAQPLPPPWPPAGASPSSPGIPQTLPGLLPTNLPGSPQPVADGAELSERVTASITMPGTTPGTMHGMVPLPRPSALLTDLDDAEIAEPTDISMPPEPPSSPRALATEIMPPLELEGAMPESDAGPPEPDAEPDAEPDGEPSGQRPRRTAIGVVIVPPGVVVLPATPTLSITTPRAAGDEATGPDERRIVVGRGAVDTGAPTIPPMPELSAANEESTPSEIWITAPAVPPAAAPPAAPIAAPHAPPHAAATALPSGDWMIARDPEAPDGWSDPFETVSSPSTPLITGAPPAEPAAPPLPGELPVAASAPPVDAAPRRPSHPAAPPLTEPKVQIDPTLIEPIHGAMPVGEPLAAVPSHDLAMYVTEPAPPGFEAPALQMMMAVPQSGPYAPPHGHPLMHTGQSPAYPLDPSYAAMPAVIPTTPSSPGLLAPSGGFGDPRYPSDPAMQAQVRRRHLIIVLASAVVAALVGIAIMLVLHGHASAPAPPPPPPGADPPQVEPGAAPAPPAAADPPTPPAPPPTAPAAPSSEHAAAGSAPAPAPTAASASPPPANPCFADVASLPAGADIVVDQNTVIGTTPQRIALPCGAPVELLIRKPRMVPVTRTVTPTPDGAPVRVTLAKQTFLVKVSSTPEGATITLYGKPLGVTPTTVKVPAFESSTLNITKDGYEPETEKVAPKANGGTVHTVLKRIDRKKPR